MMDWKKYLETLEKDKDWAGATDLIQQVTTNNPSDKEAYIRGIYLLLNILLEEDYPEDKHHMMASSLKRYFQESYPKFSNDPEYLFFIGYFIELADWYFGEDKLELANEMTKKASEIEPDNILYKWSWRFSEGDPLSEYYAEQLLKYDKQKIDWLKSKGAPGAYIVDVIERSYENYKQKV